MTATMMGIRRRVMRPGTRSGLAGWRRKIEPSRMMRKSKK